MDKKTAYLALNDEISNISIAVDKAHLLLCDLTDEYFGTVPKTEQDKLIKRFEFNRYGIISNIIFDYVYQIKEIVEKMESLKDEKEF